MIFRWEASERLEPLTFAENRYDKRQTGVQRVRAFVTYFGVTQGSRLQPAGMRFECVKFRSAIAGYSNLHLPSLENVKNDPSAHAYLAKSSFSTNAFPSLILGSGRRASHAHMARKIRFVCQKRI